MKSIGNLLFKYGYIEEQEIDIIRFSLELIVSEYLITGIIFFIMLFLGFGIEAIVHIILFTYLRKGLDGYHANSVYTCAIISSILFILATTVRMEGIKNLLLVVDVIILFALYLYENKLKDYCVFLLIVILLLLFFKELAISVISITAMEVIVLIYMKKGAINYKKDS